ncbi:TnsA endonuclease [Ruminiclostridium papyrosolvens DSM 2782]|uniref:TnsA endonuclease n=1 Tax=Ruminiclostridium papyrosolvens DSM 2782 TaxID=588581 RepID=F1T7X4_9FIRM|nr:heteromeric transposase endonuclease subunit TnsA [Ruminiclostridium papyrosolvens]EGD49572.1 TnsA endonuclease [Ruminiclostridium papyrosolvens DSM 2782]WES33304.1 heteromeric transposase endonuclease subunit TnsA [Ruminiclostridium papyrosolvens DSM 2782]
MGRYNSEWTEDKYQRFINEGRGQGTGAEYKPWLTINDYPSMGRVSRILGWKTGRVHHLFTDLQARYFYLLEWADQVMDIRECFPLLNADEVIQNKAGLDFQCFCDKKTGTPYVLQTTFLITLRTINGKEQIIARTVKAQSELEKRLTLESLEIQRRYWDAKGIDWGVITNKDIPVSAAKNIEWLHSSKNLEDRGLDTDAAEQIGALLQEEIYQNPMQLRKVLQDFEKENLLEAGTALAVFKYLLANKRLKINITEAINLNLPANHIILGIADSSQRKVMKCL